MKITKILSTVAAAAVVAGSMAATASAELAVSANPASNLNSTSGMWMIKTYCPEEGIDTGIDMTQAGSIVFTITAQDTTFFMGMTGGGVVVSCGPTSVTPADHNWVQKQYWGVTDEAIELYTQDAASELQATKVGDYTYELVCPIDDTNCVYEEVYQDEKGYVQLALSEWGQDLSAIEVVSFEILDKNGASMAKFDGDGNAVTADAPVADTETPVVDTEAPVETGKDAVDTGVEGVAAVAGVAVVAAGAVVLSKKRK